MINITPETLAKYSLCIETRHGWYKKETRRSDQYYIVKLMKNKMVFISLTMFCIAGICYLEGKYEENFIVRTKNNVGRFIFYPIVVLQRRNSFFDINFNKMYVLFPHTKPFVIFYQFLCSFSLFWAQVRFIWHLEVCSFKLNLVW